MKADGIETAIWGYVRGILENPQRVLTKIRERQGSIPVTLNRDIEKTKQDILACKNEQQRMVRLYRFGEIDDDFILKETRRLKKDQQGYEAELARLESQKEELVKLTLASEQSQELFARVSGNLGSLSFEEKRFDLQALQVRVTVHADQKTLDIQGIIRSDISYHCTNIGMTTWT